MQPVVSQGDSVIKVKSLPYDACQLDVLQFFDGFKIRPNGVQLVIQGNNKPSGEVQTFPVCPITVFVPYLPFLFHTHPFCPILTTYQGLDQF